MPRLEGDMDTQRYRTAERRLWADEGVTPKEHFVRLPRSGVEVRVQELGEGPPVLFVHGSPSAGSTWAPLAARLGGLRCLLLDRPGTGLSGPFTYQQSSLREHFETLVPDVLDALELERAHLVGSSTGSDFVLLASALHPHRVLRTVHFGCPGFAPGIRIPFDQRLISLPGLWRMVPKMFPTDEKGIRAMMKKLGHAASLAEGRITDGMLEWFGALYRDTPTLSHEMQGAARMLTLRGFHPWLVPSTEEFAAIQSPTHILWGEADVFGDKSVGQQLAGLIPNAQIEGIPAGGHLPWLDDPDRAAATTYSHLSGQASPTDDPTLGAGRRTDGGQPAQQQLP
jgi:2-hydroxy-6-oxonona-2,4-dienedioate hydrolase